MVKNNGIFLKIEDIATTIFCPGIVLTLFFIAFFEKFVLGTNVITNGLLDMEIKSARIYFILAFSGIMGLLINAIRCISEPFLKRFIKKCCRYKCKKEELPVETKFYGNMGWVFLLIILANMLGGGGLKKIIGHYVDTFSNNIFGNRWDVLPMRIIVIITVVLWLGYVSNLKEKTEK